MLQAKQCSQFVTAEMRRQNVLKNISKFTDTAAEKWVNLSDDGLWALIPSQELPRSYYINPENMDGCPNCEMNHQHNSAFAEIANFG